MRICQGNPASFSRRGNPCQKEQCDAPTSSGSDRPQCPLRGAFTTISGAESGGQSHGFGHSSWHPKVYCALPRLSRSSYGKNPPPSPSAPNVMIVCVEHNPWASRRRNPARSDPSLMGPTVRFSQKSRIEQISQISGTQKAPNPPHPCPPGSVLEWWLCGVGTISTDNIMALV